MKQELPPFITVGKQAKLKTDWRPPGRPKMLFSKGIVGKIEEILEGGAVKFKMKFPFQPAMTEKVPHSVLGPA